MRANTRQGNRRRARNTFSIEQLEVRELMAANSLSGVDALDASAAESSSSTTAASALTAVETASSRLSRSRLTLSIPTSSLAPRSLDGTGNNLADAELGSTGEQLLRVSPADYADDISAAAGEDRPSAREISNAL